MKKKIIFATNNSKKFEELSIFFNNLNIEIIPQNQLFVNQIEETGLTFVENAILKARNASYKTGLPSIADDSGISVKILEGKPGINSRRYAGINCSDQDNIKKLLYEIKNVSCKKLKAKFICIIVFLRNFYDPTPIIFDGIWEGMIIKKPIGKMGFGYDSIFYDPKLKLTAAQLTKNQKNIFSHRGKALKKLLNFFIKKT